MSKRLNLKLTDVMKATDRSKNRRQNNDASDVLSANDILRLGRQLAFSQNELNLCLKAFGEENQPKSLDFISAREDIPAFVSRLNVAEKLMGPYEQNPLELKLRAKTPEQRILEEHMPEKPTWATRRDVHHKRFEKRKKLKIRLRGLEDRIDAWLDPKW